MDLKITTQPGIQQLKIFSLVIQWAIFSKTVTLIIET